MLDVCNIDIGKLLLHTYHSRSASSLRGLHFKEKPFRLHDHFALVFWNEVVKRRWLDQPIALDRRVNIFPYELSQSLKDVPNGAMVHSVANMKSLHISSASQTPPSAAYPSS